MAVHWEWKDRIAKVYTSKTSYNVYKGNTFAVFLYEADDTWIPLDYFNDANSAKIRLGLTGECDNEFDGCWKGIKINKDDKDAMKLASYVLKAKWKDGISIYLVNESEILSNCGAKMDEDGEHNEID